MERTYFYFICDLRHPRLGVNNNINAKAFAPNLTNSSIRYPYHLIINFLTEIIFFIPPNIC